VKIVELHALRLTIFDPKNKNMRIALSFLILFVSTSLMAQRTVDIKGLVEKDGVYYYSDNPFTGKSILKYETTGKRAQEIHWRNGIIHGNKTEWFENGIVRMRMSFVNGFRHGKFSYYYDNGQMKMTGKYEKDVLQGEFNSFYRSGNPQYTYFYTDGVKNGLSTTYFDQKGGQSFDNVNHKEQEVRVVNGIPDGIMRSWYPAGNPRKVIEYSMGVRNGVYKAWHINSNQAEEAYYKNGNLDSVRRVWDNLLGTIISQEHYKNGYKDGAWIKFDQMGDTASMINYKDDKKDGLYFVIIDGQFEATGQYKEGKMHGKWETGMVSNYRRQSGTYNMGEKSGDWFYYDNKGELLMKETHLIEIVEGLPEGSVKSYYHDGKLKSDYSVRKGMLEGPFKTYHANGKPRSITDYTNGMREGKEVIFSESGDTLGVSHYNEDKLDGLFYSKIKGAIESIGNYKNDKREGSWKLRLVSKSPREEGAYSAGIRVGEWRVYNMEGLATRKIIYGKNGKKKRTLYNKKGF
jgi:antitoxin component YwqK of YwqJK toxin-antitoxin module